MSAGVITDKCVSIATLPSGTPAPDSWQAAGELEIEYLSTISRHERPKVPPSPSPLVCLSRLPRKRRDGYGAVHRQRSAGQATSWMIFGNFFVFRRRPRGKKKGGPYLTCCLFGLDMKGHKDAPQAILSHTKNMK